MTRILICFFLLWAVPAKADLAACAAFFEDAPKSLGGYQMTKAEDLESLSQGRGYATRYVRGKGDAVSVFYFNKGKTRLSRDDLLNEFRTSVGLAVSRVSRGGEQAGSVQVTADHKGRVMQIAALMHVGVKGGPLGNDYLSIGVRRNCMIKLRHTTPGPAEAADRIFFEVLKQLDAYVSG